MSKKTKGLVRQQLNSLLQAFEQVKLWIGQVRKFETFSIERTLIENDCINWTSSACQNCFLTGCYKHNSSFDKQEMLNILQTLQNKASQIFVSFLCMTRAHAMKKSRFSARNKWRLTRSRMEEERPQRKEGKSYSFSVRVAFWGASANIVTVCGF